jgi:predicted dehydrogenase
VIARKHQKGGGPMIDIGVHMLEVAHFSMGSPKPVAASGMTWTYLGNRKSNVQSTWGAWDHKTYTVEDLAVGQIRFDNGSVLSIESSFAAHTADEGMDFSIMGTKGGANWGKPEIYRDDAGHMINSQPAFLPKGGFPEMFDAKLRDFVDHVLYDKPSIISGEHGLMVQKMLDGIYASAEQGREVAID